MRIPIEFFDTETFSPLLFFFFLTNESVLWSRSSLFGDVSICINEMTQYLWFVVRYASFLDFLLPTKEGNLSSLDLPL